MTDAANPEGAVEVTDLNSAAQEIERRLSAEPEPPEEVEEEEVEEEPESEETESGEVESEDSEEVAEQEAEAEEEEAPQFQTVQELADALEIPLDEFLSTIKGTIKVDGEETEVTLSELRDGYQREADYRRKTMDLAEKRREFEEGSRAKVAEIEAQHQSVATMLNIIDQQLTSEFAGIDWNRLRTTDPAEYAAKSQEYQNRRYQIEQMKQYGSEQYQRHVQLQGQEREQMLAQVAAKERDAMYNAVPEWKDTSVMESDHKEITSYLKDVGFTTDELNTVIDHRQLLVARDAMRYRKMKAEGNKKMEIAQKKVKKLPKVVKPGKTVPPTEKAAKAAAEKKSRFKKTQRVDDLAAALFDRM